MAQGIMYTAGAPSGGFAVTAARDVIQISGSAASIQIIHEIRVGQFSDPGDAQAEMLNIEIFRATTLGAGTAAIEENLAPGAGTADAAVVVNAVVSTGLTLLMSESFNVQAGWLYLPTPASQIVVPAVATEGVVVQVSAPNDELTMTASIVWEEIGIT